MKSTILMTIALFLLSAPTPDSKTISEMSAGFLLPTQNTGLMASENKPTTSTVINKSELQADKPELEENIASN